MTGGLNFGMKLVSYKRNTCACIFQWKKLVDHSGGSGHKLEKKLSKHTHCIAQLNQPPTSSFAPCGMSFTASSALL